MKMFFSILIFLIFHNFSDTFYIEVDINTCLYIMPSNIAALTHYYSFSLLSNVFTILARLPASYPYYFSHNIVTKTSQPSYCVIKLNLKISFYTTVTFLTYNFPLFSL